MSRAVSEEGFPHSVTYTCVSHARVFPHTFVVTHCPRAQSHACTCTHMYTFTPSCIHTCSCAYIHTPIPTHTHMLMLTHIPLSHVLRLTLTQVLTCSHTCSYLDTHPHTPMCSHSHVLSTHTPVSHRSWCLLSLWVNQLMEALGFDMELSFNHITLLPS